MDTFFCKIHWLFQVLLAPLFVANQVSGREKHYGRLDEIQQPEVLGSQGRVTEGQDLDVRDLNVLGRLDESEGLLVHGRDSHVQGGGWDFHFPPAQQILARCVFLSFHKFINASIFVVLFTANRALSYCTFHLYSDFHNCYGSDFSRRPYPYPLVLKH
jgi:hypothetical protein